VPRATSEVAHFTFEELCLQPLGAADYMALAAEYRTVFLTDVPAMSRHTRDQARRFITLVDELYNARCTLVCSAAVPLDQLFTGLTPSTHQKEEEEADVMLLESLQHETATEGSRLRRDLTVGGGVAPVGHTEKERRGLRAQLSGKEEEFAFARAVSRLLEMQTPSYLSARPRVHASHPLE
jgi:predicted ATPase